MKFLPSCLTAALFAVLALANCGAATEKSPFSRRNPIVEAVQKTKNGIVTVRVPRPNGGKDMIGTGVIIDERGYIITNRHVVGTTRNVIVRLADEYETNAEVLVADCRWDLAVLKVKVSKQLTVLPLAPIDDLMVGETVIAVGNPFGYTNTVSTGIISALGREITMPTGDILTGLIQIDASINPGNSGGPLLNINGEFIGVNVALREGAQCIAFAINAATVKSFLRQHLSAVRVAGVNHGLECQEKTLAETGDRQRVLVAGFQGEGVFQQGDEIRTVASCQVANSFDIERAFWDKKPGEKVEMQVVRQGKAIQVTLTLAASNGAGQATAQSPTSLPRREMPVATVSVPAVNQP